MRLKSMFPTSNISFGYSEVRKKERKEGRKRERKKERNSLGT